jgi:hypothetical protein
MPMIAMIEHMVLKIMERVSAIESSHIFLILYIVGNEIEVWTVGTKILWIKIA